MTAAGLEIKGQDRLTSYRSDIIIALSGPVAGIGAALASFFIIKERLKHCQFSERETEMIFFFLSNSFYSAVNLLPVRGLDGGNALYALLASKCRLSTAERISFAVSAVFAAGTAVTALLIIGRSRFNYSLMVLSLSLLFELIPKKT